MYRLLLVSSLFWLCNSSLSAQLYLKIEEIPGDDIWGVFVKPCTEVLPSNNTITGSGQITVVFPAGLTFSSFTAHAGSWTVNAQVASPVESPDKTYVSAGFNVDNPKIYYHPDVETLLFSFKLTGTEPKTPALLVNGVDPFDQQPNSMNTNPGNEISVIDFGVSPVAYYDYAGNYTEATVSCVNPPQDSTGVPQDTTVVTEPQDSNIVINPNGATKGEFLSPSTYQDTVRLEGTLSANTNQQVGQNVFVVSPNPATDWIAIEFPDIKPAGGVVRLWSSAGAILGTMERRQNTLLKLNVEGLSAGLYFVTYEIDGRLIQREWLVKQ